MADGQPIIPAPRQPGMANRLPSACDYLDLLKDNVISSSVRGVIVASLVTFTWGAKPLVF